ncbi:hypothetical protein ES724_11175 [Gillisia hiemivivida]|uniref:Syntaxin-5 N-terminal Sly1p-binding domain-containing protein n=1 Tax=Gillisia hiemivivida TaxID=291190 RepID=A0A5C6ZS10_9FLAO|nr:hypothetical protein ES724_11175 [Gillisia hiemivivida]
MFLSILKQVQKRSL